MVTILKHITFVGVMIMVALLLVKAFGPSSPRSDERAIPVHDVEWTSTSRAVDTLLLRQWRAAGIQAAPAAPDLLVARRLSLALTGTIPSLEEVRMWERWPVEQRRVGWVEYLVRDPRSADYLAERFARAMVGTDDGPFLVFRRRRFVTWLSDQIHQNRPYDQLVRELLTQQGLWTSRPAVNFVTAAIPGGDEEGQPDPVQLATRTCRAFLGVRFDCMQCHDDRLTGQWRQSDFHELAAFFGDTRNSVVGVRDREHGYQATYLDAEVAVDVRCGVPFQRELLAESPSSARQRLADWMTHMQNPALSRALVNRVWALMLGRPLVVPVDDIPPEGPVPEVLDLLATDFRHHGYDLHRLIRVIAESRVFRLASAADQPLTDQHEQLWACYPLVRLRPEQVAGAVIQAASLNTLDAESHLLVRLGAAEKRQAFIQRYGDAGDQELEPLSETIPQNLLLMNGDLVVDLTRNNLVSNAATRIAQLACDDDTAVRTLFLSMLTRNPTAAELARSVQRLAEASRLNRVEVLGDLAWVLLNCSEFSWSH